MATDVETRKREEIFTKLDTNRDGTIDENDIREHITHFLSKYNISADSPQARKAMDTAKQIWQKLGSRGDGSAITKETYVQSMDQDLVENAYIPLNSVFFDVVDSDHDGKISESELVSALQRDGLSADNVREAFQRMDRDKDGDITRQEWDQAVREMLLSSDPNAPGSIMLGA
ncbi:MULTISPECIES: EF-hand domain-containing protein [Actinokineospora]|uniref:EF-hand domain-containing protein n=1 Tax=Actinokineospora fastidiosa TaxID=1816 RepID=A0A918GCW9_9PSEU|nr:MULTISPECIES: EF-hand domain-containing protein [Actinokineospora]UVS79539.1 EF hand [Actinokineospora sp. UTMC 2448]GGS29412.1 hypothetical protein GCM10010171_23380 [Actinokineospora fastidiosa]